MSRQVTEQLPFTDGQRFEHRWKVRVLGGRVSGFETSDQLEQVVVGIWSRDGSQKGKKTERFVEKYPDVALGPSLFDSLAERVLGLTPIAKLYFGSCQEHEPFDCES
jgi:hypothetical protein